MSIFLCVFYYLVLDETIILNWNSNICIVNMWTETLSSSRYSYNRRSTIYELMLDVGVHKIWRISWITEGNLPSEN
jgi:hypothetical protein